MKKIIFRNPREKLNFENLKGAARIEEAPGGHGLRSEIHYRPSPEGEYLYKEYFYAEESGRITNYIECSIKHGYKISPTCSAMFFYNKLHFKITFNRESFLPEWQQQRERAVTFLERFAIPSK